MFSHITLQNQYKDTNISELLNGIVDIRQKYIKGAFDSFKNCVDLRKASGDSLDMWGRLLNFSRFIPIGESDTKDFYNFNFYNRNFIKVKFFDRKDIKYAELPDRAYRLVLLLLWQSRNISANISQISRLATSILNAQIIVGDSLNMQFVTYYFRDTIPKWLEYILINYDILPRPTCVGSNFISAVYRIFSFQTNDSDYNKGISAFLNSRFIRDDIISQEEKDKIKETLKENIFNDIFIGSNDLTQEQKNAKIDLDFKVIFTNLKEFKEFANGRF